MIAPRYLELLEKIDEWIALPPEAPKARAATKVIEKLVRGPVRKVRRRLHNANATGDFHLLHGARKAAKRARYAAEAAEPVVGRKAAAKTAKRYQRLQDLLGEHQDSLVSADLLRRLAAKAGTIPGENGFTFGILYEREQCNATAARQSANLL
jgi:CHAD domain-containing protein